MGLSENEKARRYEMRAPGVDIPLEQKAERYDRYAIKAQNAGLSRRRGRLPQSAAVISGGSCWCECGLFKNHEGHCK